MVGPAFHGALRLDAMGLQCGGYRFAPRRNPMSPTKLAVARAKINQRCEVARKAGDLAEMQRCMAELTALHRAYYGVPPQPAT